MTLAELLALITGHRKPIPPPVVPPPSPEPTWPSDPAEANARSLAAMNVRLAEKGLPPRILSPDLCRMAMASAPRIANGLDQPHAGFLDRIMQYAPNFARWGEGVSFDGRWPEQCVLRLDDQPPGEAHRRDFEDPHLTHVGFGFASAVVPPYSQYGGYVCVVDYGQPYG